MLSFPPPNWEVRFLKDFNTYNTATTNGHQILMAAIMAIRPAEGESGNFKFVLTGPDNIRLNVPISMVLADSSLADMYIDTEVNIGEHVSTKST